MYVGLVDDKEQGFLELYYANHTDKEEITIEIGRRAGFYHLVTRKTDGPRVMVRVLPYNMHRAFFNANVQLHKDRASSIAVDLEADRNYSNL